jgi:hypothetical protein
MAKVIVTVSITRRVSASLIFIITTKGQVIGPKTKDGMILAQRAAAFVSFYCKRDVTVR